MTENEIMKIYEKHQGIINKVALKFSILYQIPLQELIEEGRFALIQELCSRWEQQFDPNKGKESTWTYQIIYWTLLTYCRAKKTETAVSLSDIKSQYQIFSQPSSWKTDLFRELSEEAVFLIKTILDTPKDITTEISPRAPKRAYKVIKAYLIDELDWNQRKFENAWQEIEGAI